MYGFNMTLVDLCMVLEADSNAKADDQGATPEQVARVILKYRPKPEPNKPQKTIRS